MANWNGLQNPGLAGIADPYMGREQYERMIREQMYLSQQAASAKSFPAPPAPAAVDNPVLLLLGEG